jgi:predicted ABC-type ATPase
MTQEAESLLRVVVFAGPNGSGKSTITEPFLRNGFDGEYINADDIARSLEPQIPDYLTRNLQAAQVADRRRQDALRAGRPFAFETVMSTPEKVAIMTQAKAAGYQVGLIFVTTDDPETNVQRVLNRVELGGHPVSPDKIRSRYHGAMALLPAAVEHSDLASIFDNSYDQELMVAAKRRGKLEILPDAEHAAWVQEKLWTPHQARQSSLEYLQEHFEQCAKENPTALACTLKTADAGHGQRYSGQVEAVTSSHVLQKVGANVYVVHDRALLPAIPLAPGKVQTLQYAYDKGRPVATDLVRDQGQDRRR